MLEYQEIKTIETAKEAIDLMRELRKDSKNVHIAVFWDRGWGDVGNAINISIIVNGNGQKPIAWITKEVYKELLTKRHIKPNSLRTFKARKCHDYENLLTKDKK